MGCDLITALALQMQYRPTGKTVEVKVGIAMTVTAHILINKAAIPRTGGEFLNLSLLTQGGKHAVNRAAPGCIAAMKAKTLIDRIGGLGSCVDELL